MDDSKILIVEDEYIIATDLKQRLEYMGHEIVGIEVEGKAAIKKTMETKPDLILMDITLKGELDGIETAEQIQNIYDVPFIYLSGSSDSLTLERAKITEPSSYIIKPFMDKGIEKALKWYKQIPIVKQSHRPNLKKFVSMENVLYLRLKTHPKTIINIKSVSLTKFKIKIRNIKDKIVYEILEIKQNPKYYRRILKRSKQQQTSRIRNIITTNTK
jgi:two-component system, response regulator PdtaR